MNQQNMLSDGESIMKCAAFIFNFNKVTVVDVKLINIKKYFHLFYIILENH